MNQPRARLPESVAAYRSRYRAEHIGARYSGVAHFVFVTAVALAAIAAALAGVHAPSAAELAVVPVAFLVSNLVEYLGHRGPMHHPRPGLGAVYRRHTQQHHHFFTAEAMSRESWRDAKIMLFPPVLLLFFAAAHVPISVVVGVLAGGNAARLFFATMIGYYLLYEWLHFSYHLSADSFVGRRWLIAALRRHHTRHHDLGRMAEGNFNITFPICDLLFGTLLRERRERRV